MATDVKAKAVETGVVPYRLSVRQFLAMIDAGIFPDCARVELLGGMLVAKMTKGNPHDYAICTLGDLFRALPAAGWSVREEKSVQLSRFDRPEPDVVVARGPRENYRRRAPRPQDIVLIVEVSESTYAKDRGEKWWRYAAARLPAYWILNIPNRQLEVYGSPAGRGKSAVYRDAVTFGPDEEAPVVIDGREVGRIAVRDLLP